jgi:protein ImuB
MSVPIPDLFAAAQEALPSRGERPPWAAAPAREPEPVRSPSLWACLYFSGLPIEVFAVGPEEPAAILVPGGRTAVVLTGSPAAWAAGIRAGMPVNAALALVPQLRLLDRDPCREHEALARLGAWALRFSSRVALGPGHAVMVEVGGSARCFGGLSSLWLQLLDDLRTVGHACVAACAPTIRAALCLVRVGRQEVLVNTADLPGQLAGLPLAALGWTPPVLRVLQGMGVRTIGECVRLPREGLARRIGMPRLRDLDELFGRVPEVLASWQPSEGFRESVELPCETADQALLAQALVPSLGRLGDVLRSRQATVPALWIRLLHRRQAPTVLRVGLLEPCSDAGALWELLELHLAKGRLPAPATALELEANLIPQAASPEELFGPSQRERRAWLRLVERLRTRLGFTAVHAVRRVPDHAPERAWRAVTGLEQADSPGTADALVHLQERPLWLLAAPLAMPVTDGGPVFQGALRLRQGPERIETGWWTGEDVRRDYYVASNPQGMVLWVFRDRRDGRWYLHGLYG